MRRKIITAVSVLAAAAIGFTMGGTATGLNAEISSLRGDVNGDGKVNILDFMELKSILLGVEEKKTPEEPVELSTDFCMVEGSYNYSGENVSAIVKSEEEYDEFLKAAGIDSEKLGVWRDCDGETSGNDFENNVYAFCTVSCSSYHTPERQAVLSDKSLDVTISHYNDFNGLFLFRTAIPKEYFNNQTVNINEKFKQYAEDEPLPAKPVIYLYPEKTTDINVKLNINEGGSLTYTYPLYNPSKGWNVTAEPDSVLHDASGREYSYLFWEGVSDQKWDMTSGFVVKGSDTVEFLQEKLEYLGLTPKEYNEFIVYWMPKMQSNKYNLIAFQTDKYEEYAELEITPEPDCIQRVFMAYMPLDEYREIPEQKLEAFERHGYSVIEWGGAEITDDIYTVQ